MPKGQSEPKKLPKLTIGDLKGAEYNPRKITDWELEQLGYSMEEFGELSGVIFNRNTGCLVGGHQRKKQFSKKAKIIRTPYTDDTGTIAVGYIEDKGTRWFYREVMWDQKKEIAANIAANQHGGSWDYPLLRENIVQIDDGSFAMGILGFTDGRLRDIYSGSWNSDLSVVNKIQETDEGIPGKIVLFCRPENTLEVKNLIEMTLREAEYEDIKIK